MAGAMHRSSQSLSSNGSYNTLLNPPQPQPIQQQRRMSHSSPTQPSFQGQQQRGISESPQPRSRSPLRQAMSIDPSDGRYSRDGSPLPSDGDPWGQRSVSPTPSITQYASHLVNRVGSLMSSVGSPQSQSQRLLTDAELEAEAERERERSRREAHRIIEAENRARRERLQVEESVLAMLDRGGRTTPSRSQTMPLPEPISPATSQRDGKDGIWTAVKNRLTPTKESLTPAQQIIQDAKQREKAEKKKGRDKSPANSSLSDSPLRTPQQPYSLNMSLTSHRRPSFSASTPALVSSPGGIPQSSSSEQPSIYCQFDPQGNLNVHNTLMTIAKRFEKLEKWTVGHVRALEDRMADVERWLVDKEKEKEKEQEEQKKAESIPEEPSNDSTGEIQEIRDELMELQARLGEMGREMARLATSPSNLSSGPAAKTASPEVAPQTNSSIASRSLPPLPQTQTQERQLQRIVSPTSTSPRTTSHKSASLSSNHTKSGSRTRLPYPTGDYTSPELDTPGLRRSLSPALDSPTSSISSASRGRHMSVAGLPHSSDILSMSMPLSKSPSPSPSQQSGLPEPVSRVLSPSGGRKRYTVALGGPLTAPRTPDRADSSLPDIATAFFSSSEEPTAKLADSLFVNHWDEEDHDVTIGRAASKRSQTAVISHGSHFEDEPRSNSPALSATSSPAPAVNSTIRSVSPSPSPSAKGKYNPNRTRAQSSYGAPAGFSLSASPTPSPGVSPGQTKPLHTRVRSQSQDGGDRLSANATLTALNSEFVDPVMVRRRERDSVPLPSTPKATTGKRPPVGELVAFFNQDRKK